MTTALVYNHIGAGSVAEFIGKVDDAEANSEDLVVRVNTNGGNPEYGYGMIARLKEFEGKATVKVDGKAFSMGAFFCAACDNVEALNTAEFLLHRAAYPSWFEQSESFTEDLRANLDRTNKALKTILESKVDVQALKAIIEKKKDYAGSYADLWSMETRADLFLTAAEAKKIGLISKIVNITKEKVKTVNAYVEMAASYESNDFMLEYPESTTENKETPTEAGLNTNTKINKMTAKDFQTQHPEAYSAMVKEVSENAVKNERSRVQAWNKWRDVDAKLVDESIASGANFNEDPAVMSELMLKKATPNKVKDINASTSENGELKTTEVDKPENQTEEQKIASNVKANFEALMATPESK